MEQENGTETSTSPFSGTDLLTFSQAIKTAGSDIHQIAWSFDTASRSGIEIDIAKIDAFIIQLQKTWQALRYCIELNLKNRDQ